MIAELFDLIYLEAPILILALPVILITVGLVAGLRTNPALGPLVLVSAYVIDCGISNWIVANYNLSLDRFPNSAEAVAYGVISMGWMIGGVIRAVSGAIRLNKRGRLRWQPPRVMH